MNKVIIMGRLTAAPELKKTSNNISVTSFCVAVPRAYAKQGEERQTDFIDCVAWRNTADFICKYFTKGNMIALDGTLQTRMYEDRNGNKRKAVEILVESAYFTGSKSDSAQAVNPTHETRNTLDIDVSDNAPAIPDDGDLPF